MTLKNMPPAAIPRVLEALRTVTTASVRDLGRPVVSSNASVQGPWDPSTTFDSFQLGVAPAPLGGGAAASGGAATEGKALARGGEAGAVRQGRRGGEAQSG